MSEPQVQYATTPTVAQVFSDNGREPQPRPRKLIDPDILLTAGAHDEGNAQCMLALYGNQFKYCPVIGWLFYNGRYWDSINAEEHLTRAIVDTLKTRRVEAVRHEREPIVKAAKPSTHNVRQCRYLFQSLVPIDVKEFDRSPDLLNCWNGVLDLRTGELTPHNSRQLFTYAIPVDYDPDADATVWTDLLLDLTGDAAIVEYLQTAVGYSLTGHTREEILFYIHGPTRAGKGLFVETILAMLGGKPLGTEVDFGTFSRRRDHDAQNFDLAPLKPCRFVAASESGRYEQVNAEAIKRLTGGNYIYCAYKHKTHFSYRPQFKVWLTSNHPVNADVDDNAVWCRLRVIEFPNSYAGNEDKALKDRLKRPEIQQGVLCWAVDGAMAWYALPASGLQTPQRIVDVTEQARAARDFVGQWLEEEINITNDEDDFAPNFWLYASYDAWCRRNGETPKSRRGLTTALKGKGLAVGERKYIPTIQGNKQVRGVSGIESPYTPIEP